jgi:dynein heavy chain, axonemal
MTERAQRSLIVALQYHYGGAPEGPFGTGKTETTKDLARALGRQCYVLNTSASYDYDNVVKFFKGVCASGAWVCFDEFNRLESNVLSFLSSTILLIHNGLRAAQTFVHLDD